MPARGLDFDMEFHEVMKIGYSPEYSWMRLLQGTLKEPLYFSCSYSLPNGLSGIQRRIPEVRLLFPAVNKYLHK